MTEIINFDYTVFLRLLAAMVLGGLIGLERDGSNHEAGLRTHIILCLGAALVMVMSENLVKQYGSGDIMRMGAQVVSGVGFLGVGSIIFDGNKIRGITTAAGLWTTACVGLAVGAGYYIIASVVVGMMLFAMLWLRTVMRKIRARSLKYCIKIDLTQRADIKVLKKFIDKDIQIYSVRLEDDDKEICALLEIRLRKKGDIKVLMNDIATCDGVRGFELL